MLSSSAQLLEKVLSCIRTALCNLSDNWKMCAVCQHQILCEVWESWDSMHFVYEMLIQMEHLLSDRGNTIFSHLNILEASLIMQLICFSFSYLERMAFLDRTDHRQFQLEKALRQSSSSSSSRRWLTISDPSFHLHYCIFFPSLPVCVHDCILYVCMLFLFCFFKYLQTYIPVHT